MTSAPRFDYNDIVRVKNPGEEMSRIGAKAWIVGVTVERRGSYYDQFPAGPVYTIEYEDGSSHDVPEQDLEIWTDP